MNATVSTEVNSTLSVVNESCSFESPFRTVTRTRSKMALEIQILPITRQDFDQVWLMLNGFLFAVVAKKDLPGIKGGVRRKRLLVSCAVSIRSQSSLFYVT